MTVLYLLIAILVFGFLIFIHELGHFIAAKLCGVRVNEFSINMGPKLFGWKRGETQYSFRLLPIGGYCAMEGEDEDTGDPRAFTAAKWWKRLIILCAGSFMNLLTGFVVVAILFGFFYQIPTSKIVSFEEGSAIAEQGVQVGDEIWTVDGRRTYSSTDFTLLDGRFDPNDTELVVIRNGEKVVFPHFRMEKREFDDGNGGTVLRYGMSFGFAEASVSTVTRFAADECMDFARTVWYGLQDMVGGKVSMKEIGGPAKITQIMVETGEEVAETNGVLDAILNILYIGALIAVNLAVMNMLPIPALDGGRVLFLLINTVYTAITKKKINPKYEGYVHGGAMILLLAFMAFIFVKDIVEMF